MSGVDSIVFHHIGYAVRNNKISMDAFRNLGVNFFHASDDVERNLRFDFGEISGTIIELVSPLDEGKKCDVTNIVNKQPCTPYHVCFETEDIENTIAFLKEKKFRPMMNIEISDVYGYKVKGVFVYSKGTGLIEVIEKSEKYE